MRRLTLGLPLVFFVFREYNGGEGMNRPIPPNRSTIHNPQLVFLRSHHSSFLIPQFVFYEVRIPHSAPLFPLVGERIVTRLSV